MKSRNYWLIGIIAAILFLPFIGDVKLFDWDEINFAEAAREMIVTGDWSSVRIDFEPFHEKPPVFIWVQAVSMEIFGVNEFAARLPNALMGILTLCVIYSIGKLLYDERFGIFWALAYLGSFLPDFYFRTGIIDPYFNFFIFMSIYFFFRYLERYGKIWDKYLIFSLIFNAFAVMTKGPVGYGLAFLTLTIFALIKRKKFKFPFLALFLMAVVSLVPLVSWFAVATGQSGGKIFTEFISYQIRLLTTNDAGHGGPFYYHFVVLLFGAFPASIFLIRSFRHQAEDSPSQDDFKLLSIILLSVVLVVFSIVKTKIVHYSSMAYFPITYLAAYTMYYITERKMQWKVSTTILTGTIGILFALALILLPLALMNVDMILPKISDDFTKEVLKANAHWEGFEYLAGVFYLITLAIFMVLINKNRFRQAFVTLYGSTALTVFLVLPLLAPRIEEYTQEAPIEFFTKTTATDCYLETLGYKSYAHYFYGRRKPKFSKAAKGMNRDEFDKWLLEGDIDHNAYFSSQMYDAENYMRQYPDLIELYRKNGFVFMVRKAK